MCLRYAEISTEQPNCWKEGVEVCESTMVPALHPMVDASLGNVYVHQGRGREELSMLTSASEQLLSQNLKV